MTACRIGTAGWGNPPALREHRSDEHSHLQHYATCFNAVEINSSFYRCHARNTYERWAADTPAGFRFSVKVPRAVTHEAGLKHCRPEMRRFLQEVGGLGGKLGVILVQTPASLAFDRRTATRFFRFLTDPGIAQVVIEPRHPSWFTAGAQTTLSELNISRVVADPARFQGADRFIESAQLIYYRLHGSPRMYYSAYTEEYLTKLGKEIRMLRSASREVWCMFDNTARHESWGNALRLRQLLTESGTIVTGSPFRPESRRTYMSSAKQKAAARTNIKMAAKAAKSKKTIAHLSKRTRTALGKEGAKKAKRARRG